MASFASVTPAVVAHQFIDAFYKMLNNDPASAYQFYNDDSTFVRIPEGTLSGSEVTGQMVRDIMHALGFACSFFVIVSATLFSTRSSCCCIFSLRMCFPRFQNIKKAINALKYRNPRVNILSIDAQNSIGDCVVVMVSGLLILPKKNTRKVGSLLLWWLLFLTLFMRPVL